LALNSTPDVIVCVCAVSRMVLTSLRFVAHRHTLPHLDQLVTLSSVVATVGTMTAHWHETKWPETGVFIL